MKADPQRAKEGTTVTLTVTPEEGYTIDDVTVTDQDGKEIPVTDQGDGKYTFPMPAGKVTVSASFTKGDTGYAHCPKDETCPIWPFTDASPTAWYHDGVHYCLDHGLMGGYPGSLFGPDDATTRGMIVTILYRLEGEPAAGSSDFTDVPAGQYYTDAVAWAAANGIVNGYGDGAFGPEDPIAREQMAAILYRYAAYKEYDVTARGDLSGYTDADQISPYAMDAMAWVNGEGILAGTSATTLDPAGTTTRAQSATILMRCCVNVMK
ncbi:MAG: S-layer homology domain-containing protein [Clostridiales bacterium]|nr:S-layer homology domain-containing protein [Clostridiales bacterium]